MNNVNVERALGRLEAKVGTLIADMEHDKTRRKEQYQRLTAIERSQDTAEKDRANMAQRLGQVEKNTAEFNKWKERDVDAFMLISAIAALIGGALAASWHKILDIFK